MVKFVRKVAETRTRLWRFRNNLRIGKLRNKNMALAHEKSIPNYTHGLGPIFNSAKLVGAMCFHH